MCPCILFVDGLTEKSRANHGNIFLSNVSGFFFKCLSFTGREAAEGVIGKVASFRFLLCSLMDPLSVLL